MRAEYPAPSSSSRLAASPSASARQLRGQRLRQCGRVAARASPHTSRKTPRSSGFQSNSTGTSRNRGSCRRWRQPCSPASTRRQAPTPGRYPLRPERTPTRPSTECRLVLSRRRQADPTATNSNSHARHDQTASRRSVRIEHLVVDVVAERVGDGEQQTVGRRQRGGKAASGDETGDHVRHARDLGCREHDHVRIDVEILPAQKPRMTSDLALQAAITSCGLMTSDCRRLVRVQVCHMCTSKPAARPAWFSLRSAEDLKFRERCIGRRREVKQEDEEQRPRHRLSGLHAPTGS